MKITVLIVSMLVSGVISAASPETLDLELRSISIGESAESAIEASSEFEVSCFPRERVDGVPMRCTVYAKPVSEYTTRGLEEFNFAVDAEGKVEKVTQVQPIAWFVDTVEALTRKFGPPTSDTSSEVTTGLGVKLDQRTLTWVRGGSRLSFIKRMKADESVIDLRRELSAEEARAEREARVQRAAEKI